MQSIGERLKEARERKGVSLREAAEATKIRGDYLQKIEGNKFDFGLTALYVRGFIRTYAGYLKIPADRLLADFEALGYGEPNTPRPLNREVYGKLDLGSSSADEPADAPAGSPGKSPAPGRATSNRRPRNLQPEEDQNGSRTLYVQLGIILGGGTLVIALLVWGLTAIFSGGRAKPSAPESPSVANRSIDPNATATIPAPKRVPAGQILLTALGSVRVQVWEQTTNTANPYGKVLLASTSLAPGESRSIQTTSPVIVFADTTDNLQVDTASQSIKVADWKAKLNGSQYLRLQP